MEWTKKQIETMADAYFQGSTPTCPAPCGGRVAVQEHMTALLPAAALDLSCPLCGTTGSRPRTPSTTPWTKANLEAIRTDYHREGSASCPGDGALLDVQQIGAGLGVACKKCGQRTF